MKVLARSSGEPRRIDLAVEPPFRLGALRVVPALRQLCRGEESRTLEPRVMQVLVALVHAQGDILSRDMLIDSCWDGRIVGDNALNRVISLLRHLGAELGGAFEIETITKVGYRLKVDGASAANSHDASEPSGPRTSRRAAIAIVAAAGLAGATWFAAPMLSPKRKRALQLYRAGLEIERQGDPERATQAIAYFERATQADPGLADAWGALARARLRFGYGDDAATAASAAKVRSAARHALRLDPENSDALLALVMLRPIFRHWAAAEAEARAALARRPELTVLRQRIGFCRAATGRFREALPHFEAAAAREPLVPDYQLSLASTCWRLGDLPRARRLYDAAIGAWREDPWVWLGRFVFLSLAGRPVEALAMTGRDAPRDTALGPLPMSIAAACAQALINREAAAREKAVAAIVAARATGDIASFISIQYLPALGAVDLAFEHAYTYYMGRRDPLTGERQPLPETSDRWTDILFAASTTPMRADPRFARLTEAIGIEDYWRSTGTRPDYRRA